MKKSAIRFTLAASATLLALAAPAAEPTKEEVQTYLNNVRASHNKLHAAGAEFGKALGPALKGEVANVSDLNRKYRHCSKTLAKVRADTKSWRVPDHAAARELAKLNTQFLESQIGAILTVLPEVMDIVEDDGVDAAAKQEKLTKVLGMANAGEKDAGAKVREAWKKLAQDFGIPTDK